MTTSASLCDTPAGECLLASQEVAQILASLNVQQIREAVALLQLAKEYGYGYDDVDQALHSRELRKKKCMDHYMANKDEQNKRFAAYMREKRKRQKEQGTNKNENPP